jgi:ATP-dependent Clp protease ATP-binding subunit ClpB
LNRIDEIVLFDILSKEAILEIVKLRIKVVKERIESKGIYFDINNEALEYLALEGYNPHYGARPLNRLIQNKILNPLANLMIGNNVRKGDSVSIGIKNNELNIITKKGKIKSNLKIKSRLKA